MTKTLGIGSNYEGLRILRDNISFFFPPSSFAEAVIGIETKTEIRKMLDSVTVDLYSGNIPYELPSLDAFLQRLHGEERWSELEQAIKRHHEGTKNLLARKAMLGEKTSPLEVSRGRVKRRGSAVHERDRNSVIRGYKFLGDELPPEFDISCRCPSDRYYSARTKYRRKDPTTTHLACYHLAAHLYHVSATQEGVFLPFDFRQHPELALEALVMRKVNNKDYAEVDRFLLDHDVLTEQAKEMVRNRKATVEVLRSQYEFGDEWKIIDSLEQYARQRGYHYKGFAIDFQNRPEQTVGIVYERTDGAAVHILFDQKVWTMPFIVAKVPESSAEASYSMQIEGPLLKNLNRRFLDFDVRTQKPVVSVVRVPPDDILITVEQLQAYNTLRHS